jgi:gamma-glutamyltranspeptidase/glutathione hydrolase
MAEQCTGRGRRGVVVAAAPTAAAIGTEMLRAGGNAYDAAVAALLAETVLLPPKCGLAGDLVALRQSPEADGPMALLAIGGAPRRLGDEILRRGDLPETGPLSVGVPGAPAGYAALADDARFALAELAAPAIELARGGVPWAPICTVLGEEAAELVATHTPHGTRYFPGGRPPEPGELVVLAGLAAVLEEFVARGAALFAGPVGDAVVAAVRVGGGVLEIDDVAAGEATWVAPAHVVAAGYDLWATPAPTHGPSLLDAVTAAHSAGTPDAGHVLRAVLDAARRRRTTLGDPLAATATSMVSAADAEGNAVTVVHSNSYPRFGSGLVVDEYDLILANRAGRGFTGEPGHPNFPRPGQRPATTLHAWAARSPGGETLVLGGTPGGVNQMPWNAQTLQAVLGGELDPGRLVVAPKWEWLPDREAVRVEAGLPASEQAALSTASGTPVEGVEEWALRSAQQVIVAPVPGRAVVGGVDPRTGGLALGV